MFLLIVELCLITIISFYMESIKSKSIPYSSIFKRVKPLESFGGNNRTELKEEWFHSSRLIKVSNTII